MDATIELDVISSFAQNFATKSTIELLDLPKERYDDMLYFSFLGEQPRMVNAWQSEHVRQWRIVNFHKHPAKALETATALSRAFVHGITIPYRDEERKMWFTRVQSYSVGELHQEEGGNYGILSILETKTGAVHTEEQYELMLSYIMRIGG